MVSEDDREVVEVGMTGATVVLGRVVVEDVANWLETLEVLEVLEMLEVLEVLKSEELGPRVPEELEDEGLVLRAPFPGAVVLEMDGVDGGGADMFDRSSVRRKIEL